MYSVDIVKTTANFLTLLATCCFILSLMAKSKRGLTALQIADALFHIVAIVMVGGYSGAVVMLVALTRNILVYTNKINKNLTVMLLVCGGVIGLLVNVKGFVGLIPIVASSTYSVTLCNKKSTLKQIKISLVANTSLWAIYKLIAIGTGAFVGGLLMVVVSAYQAIVTPQDAEREPQITRTELKPDGVN